MNSKLFYIIIILIIVTITIYINKYYVNKEGMDIGQFFGFVIKIFQLIPKLVEGIITLFSLMDDVFDMISCPYNIWSNFFTCFGWFWPTDFLFNILFIIWWILLYIFIFTPCYIGWNILCLIFGDMFNACTPLEVNDICPTKEEFFKIWDFIFFLIGDFHLLYRNKNDIKKCYCHPAVKYGFGPLEEEFEFVDSEKLANKSYEFLSLIIAFFVLFIIYFKQSAHSTYRELKNISSPSGTPSVSNSLPSLPSINPIADLSKIKLPMK